MAIQMHLEIIQLTMQQKTDVYKYRNMARPSVLPGLTNFIAPKGIN